MHVRYETHQYCDDNDSLHLKALSHFSHLAYCCTPLLRPPLFVVKLTMLFEETD